MEALPSAKFYMFFEIDIFMDLKSQILRTSDFLHFSTKVVSNFEMVFSEQYFFSLNLKSFWFFLLETRSKTLSNE